MEQIDIRTFRKKLRRFERLNQILNSSCCKGVTMAQCHALLEIEELSEATTMQLAKNLILDKSTLSRTVDNLVKRGLVERKQNKADRRFTKLILTEEGVRTCDEINQANDNTYRNILSQLPQNEVEKIITNFEQFVKLLNKFNQSADNNECCKS